MNKHRNLVVGTVATISLVAGPTSAAIAAETPQSPIVDQTNDSVGQNVEIASAYVQADASEGSYSWTQGTVTPNPTIKAVFTKATSALCNSITDLAQDNPLQWRLRVSGDVENAFTATVDDLAKEAAVKQSMSCTCGGNPSDGAATITADVKGIPVSHLIHRAAAADDANVVTFVASDGTELSIPIACAVGRHAVISFEINGEDLSASVGGNNQLWLANTSANYFLRDIVEVRITHEDVLPANPGEDMEYPNSPNAGIQAGTAR